MLKYSGFFRFSLALATLGAALFGFTSFASAAIITHEVIVDGGAGSGSLGSNEVRRVDEGQMVNIQIFIDFDASEDASILDAGFSFLNSGAALNLTTGDPSYASLAAVWPGGVAGSLSDSGGRLSLTSTNVGGRRLFMDLNFQAGASGIFQVSVADFLLGRDLDNAPFFEELSVLRVSGEPLGADGVIATVVVPEPGTALLLGLGLAGLTGASRRRYPNAGALS